MSALYLAQCIEGKTSRTIRAAERGKQVAPKSELRPVSSPAEGSLRV
jgi:hypothetical protein